MSNMARYASGSLAPNWTACFASSDLNSLAAGATAVSSIAFDNTTYNDLWCNLSFSITGTTPGAGSPNIGLYVLPLSFDGSTYGDGSVSGATPPSVSLFERAYVLPFGRTSAVMVGTFRRIVLPEGAFKFAIANNSQNALAANGQSVFFRTYVENLNG